MFGYVHRNPDDLVSGPENYPVRQLRQARVSTEDWLEELTLMDRPSRSIERKWRAVTIAAAARLAKRLDTVTHCQICSAASTDTKVSPIPSSNCFGSTVMLRWVHRIQRAAPCTQQKLL